MATAFSSCEKLGHLLGKSDERTVTAGPRIEAAKILRLQESSDSDVELVPSMAVSPHAVYLTHSPSAPTAADWEGRGSAFAGEGPMDERASEIMHAGSEPQLRGAHYYRHQPRLRRHDGLLPTMLRAAARASNTVISARCGLVVPVSPGSEAAKMSD